MSGAGMRQSTPDQSPPLHSVTMRLGNEEHGFGSVVAEALVTVATVTPTGWGGERIARAHDLGVDPHMTGRTFPPGELRPALDDLVHRYASLADLRRLDALVELFSPAGVLVLPAPPERLEPHHEVRGRSAILEHLAVLEDLSVTAHELVGQVYDATGPGSATGRVACVAHHVADGRDVVWHLHYNDTYVVEEGTWRFARRALYVDFISTHRVSLHR